MKRITAILLAAALALSLWACKSARGNASEEAQGNAQGNALEGAASSAQGNASGGASGSAQENAPSAAPVAATDGEGDRILIAYFSWADNAAEGEQVDAITSPSVTKPGNVAQLASWIQEETGGDLFSIQVEEPYPADWDSCLERANEERAENARPQLTGTVEEISDYEVVFLGYALAMYRYFNREPKIRFLSWEKWCQYVGKDDLIDHTYYHIARSGQYSIDNAKRLLEYAPKYTTLETVEAAVASYLERGIIQVHEEERG